MVLSITRTHLLHRLGYLKDGKAKIMVVDTFHLFPETMEFLREIEDYYGFKAEVFCAEGVPVGDKEAYDKKYGANLWKEDIEQYDKVCKVEPFHYVLELTLNNCRLECHCEIYSMSWVSSKKEPLVAMDGDKK